MKFHFISFFLLGIFISNFINCQTLNYEGLELFNPYMQNPAFIVAEKTIQIDFIGSVEWTKISKFPLELSINSISTIDKLNSSFRLSFDYLSFSEMSSRSLNIGYSYNHSISEDFQLMAGISLNPNKYKYELDLYDIYTDPPIFNSYESKRSNLELGIGAKYKKLTVGLGSRQKLFENVFATDTYDNDTVYNVKGEFNKLTSIVKYDFSIGDYLILSPQVKMDYYNEGYSGVYRLRIFPGLIANYNNLLGAGFAYDNGTIFMGSISFSDIIRLYIVAYKDKTILYNRDGGWDITGQFRINF